MSRSTKQCTFPDCGGPLTAYGLCQSHRWQQRQGHELKPIAKNRMWSPAVSCGDWKKSPEERFWLRVDKTSGPIDPALGRCWIWTAGRFNAGYGAISVKRKTLKAHRFSWSIHNGPLPDDLLIRHLCNNPPCVNPAHLATGDSVDNAEDMMRSGRCGSVTIPYETVLSIRERHRTGAVGYKTIAKEFGLHPVEVQRFVKMKRRKYPEPTRCAGGV